MTVKALEELVGMTRANIRFYEQEGLLAPTRLENGYRDYSEEDADVLRKIKLFRRLHLELDAIRRVQSGELTLPQALAEQLDELERDQAALDRARQVCRELKSAGTGYAALDPDPWLKKLAEPPAPASPRYAPPADVAPPLDSTLYPWRRYFARAIDFLLYGLLWMAFSSLVLHWRPESNALVSIFDGYVEWALLFLFEPALLHLWGTTPGKALFGISIRDADGKKLSWKHALNRAWMVFSRGYGWNIPIYSLWRLWKSYRQCRDGIRDECWEGYLDRRHALQWEDYRVADGRAWRCAACAGVYGLAIALGLLIMLQSAMPPNRGELTAAEFYENCNFYMDYYDLGGGRLDENGRLVRPEPEGNVAVTTTDLSRSDTVFSVILTDGVVTGVTVTRTVETSSGLWVNRNHQMVALMALAGSIPRMDCINLKRVVEDVEGFIAGKELGSSRIEQSFASKLESIPDVKIEQTTKLTDFKPAPSPSFLMAKEGRIALFRQEFTVTLVPQEERSKNESLRIGFRS